jgi:hypothetical protein
MIHLGKTKSTIISKEFLPEDLKIVTVVWYAFHQMQITQEIFRNATPC